MKKVDIEKPFYRVNRILNRPDKSGRMLVWQESAIVVDEIIGDYQLKKEAIYVYDKIKHSKRYGKELVYFNVMSRVKSIRHDGKILKSTYMDYIRKRDKKSSNDGK